MEHSRGGHTNKTKTSILVSDYGKYCEKESRVVGQKITVLVSKIVTFWLRCENKEKAQAM